jgi:hypothetical protein
MEESKIRREQDDLGEGKKGKKGKEGKGGGMVS